MIRPAAIGLLFGFLLCWTGMVDPDVIRGALLFREPYLFLFFASAVGTAAIGLQVLRRVRGTEWAVERPERRHVTGALVFGLGWGVAGACPGPIAANLGQGIAWALPLIGGVLVGIKLFERQGRTETEPPCDVPRAPEPMPARVPTAV